MFWNDVSFLVVSSSVTGKFKDFSSKVLLTAARYTVARICPFLTRGHQYGDDKSPKNECMCVCV